MKIVVLDPAVENVNAGDEIISESIQTIPGLRLGEVTRLTTHRLLRRAERRLISESDLVVLGGTNALSSHMERFRQWPVDPELAGRLRGKLLLLGVGWWQYQEPPCRYTSMLIRMLSSREIPHSVRDQYTLERLTQVGVPAVMTSCPTMWPLQGRPQGPLGKSDRAVITVTDYKRAEDTDRKWIAQVTARYSQVTAIGMAPADEPYFSDLQCQGVAWGGFGTKALEEALPGADFIGTRLHAGVRAIQIGRPALILGVDNRATEIGRDTGLQVTDRRDAEAVGRVIDSRATAELTLPATAVSTWLEAFSRLTASS